jgi:UDP-N-acetyl-D-mannosaminuronic acid dehydrogenase
LDQNICILGLGYVGLTLAAVMAAKGLKVFGVDINSDLIKELNSGHPHFFEQGLGGIINHHLHKQLKFFTEIPSDNFRAFIITVGTPLLPGTRTPNLSYLCSAARSVASHLSNESIVILRSTVPIGATRGIVLPILKKEHTQVHLAFCPERTVEGRALEEIQTLPQIIGGLDQESTDRSIAIFRELTPLIIPVSSLETAEMIKLLDNSYRDLTFAFANQIAELCKTVGVDSSEVIEAGNRGYARNRVPTPGYVGGACLEKDPYLLSYSVKPYGINTALVQIAREINESVPQKVAQQIYCLLTKYGKNPKKAKVFLTGIAFKGRPQTDDLRGSPSLALIEALYRLDVKHLVVHDFVVPEKSLTDRGLSPIALEAGFSGADAVIIGNNHLSYESLNVHHHLAKAHLPVIFFDSWRLYDPASFPADSGIHYDGLGYARWNPHKAYDI